MVWSAERTSGERVEDVTAGADVVVDSGAAPRDPEHAAATTNVPAKNRVRPLTPWMLNARASRETGGVSAREIDRYLATLDEPKRATLASLRASILEVVPDAEQCISYRMPAFKVDGKVVAGFAAFTNHLSYLPHSGSVLPALADDVARYEQTKGSLHFAIDKPLPKRLVRKLVTTRLRQLGLM